MQSTQIQVTDLETTLVTPAITLRAAAQYLQSYGWIQGAYYDSTAVVFTPAACMVGALGMVCYGGPVDAPALNFDDPGFAQFEAALAFLDWYVIDSWKAATAYEYNDAFDRVAYDVIKTLEDAATCWQATRADDWDGA